MLKRFGQIRGPLLMACDDAGVDEPSIRSDAFSWKVKIYE